MEASKEQEAVTGWTTVGVSSGPLEMAEEGFQADKWRKPWSLQQWKAGIRVRFHTIGGDWKSLKQLVVDALSS